MDKKIQSKLDALKENCKTYMQNNLKDWGIAFASFSRILTACDYNAEVNNYIQDCIEEIEQYLWNKEERERDCKQGNL